MKNYLTSALLLLSFLAVSSVSGREPEWERAESMSIARSGFAAAKLGNRIYVFGGETVNGRRRQLTASCEFYDLDRDEWMQVDSLPRPLLQASAVTIGRNIYIVGGTVGQEAPSEMIYKLDQRTGTFSTAGRIPSPRWAAGVVGVGGRILVAGGVTSRQNFLRDCAFWIPDSNRWEMGPALNETGAGAGIVSQPQPWIIGGFHFGPLARIERLVEGRWELLPERLWLPEPLGQMGVSIFSDSLLVVAGGQVRRGVSREVRVLNLRSLTWSELPSMHEPRSDFQLIAHGSKLFAIGGASGGPNEQHDLYSSVEVYSLPESVEPKDEYSTPQEAGTFVWPNPANGSVSISYPLGAEGLLIFDPSGRLIHREFGLSKTNEWKWNVGGQPAGSYRFMLSGRDGELLAEDQIIIVK